MLLFSKICEFYCLYGIEVLLSGATGAARQNSYEGLHIFSYKALFRTFYHFFPIVPTFSNFFPILRMKLSYIYYYNLLTVYNIYKYHCIVELFKAMSIYELRAVYKGRPANGEGVVLKFWTFPDGGRGWFVKVRTSKNF